LPDQIHIDHTNYIPYLYLFKVSLVALKSASWPTVRLFEYEIIDKIVIMSKVKRMKRMCQFKGINKKTPEEKCYSFFCWGLVDFCNNS
jgi:hypothetical protein